jgi:hypothetical protein
VFGKLKAGWRLWGMKMVVSAAMGLNFSRVFIGTASDTDRYAVGAGAGLNWYVGAETFLFNDTVALNYGELLTDDVDLIGTCNAIALWHAPSRAIITVNYTR